MEHPVSIYSFIETEENRFSTDEVKVYDNYDWSMRNHIQMCLMLKDGYYTTGENNWLRPFKKVIEPLLELANTAEDIELKDITLSTDNKNNRVLSFFLKKYHNEVYAKEHDIDTLIDEITESDNAVGGVLVQKGADFPEVIKLVKLAFCDQTDILGGPIGFKYSFSPSKLRKMSEVGWGDEKNGANITLDDLIILAEPEKEPAGSYSKKNRTTGKNIEVYIVRGDLPEHYLKDNDNMEDYYQQLHIVAFYKNEKEKRTGVTLYRKEANEEDLKFHTSKPVEGKGLGKGADIFFNEQIWTNFLEIHKMKMLEGAAKNIIWTDDPAYTNRQQIIDMENNEVTQLEEGKRMGQVPTVQPVSVQLYERAIDEWFQNAQLVGFAQDVQLGRQSYAGQTFKGQERLLQQGRGPHERAKGKRAKFIEQIYRDWIIPDMTKKILKGTEFLATLTGEEMEWVADNLVINQTNKWVIDTILNDRIPTPEEIELQKQTIRDEFMKSGNKQKLEILKDEFRDVEIKMDINVAGKQKDLGVLTDKVLSILQFVISNPPAFQQAMQIPALSNALNDILEFSGLNQADFYSLMKAPLPALAAPTAAPTGTPAQLSLTPTA